MALSGSLSTNVLASAAGYDAYNRYYVLDWTATQSTSDNTSTITWTLSAASTTDQTAWVAERTLVATIDGQTVYSKSDRVERRPGTISTGTITLTHDSDGNKSFTITISAAVIDSTIRCSASGTATLDQIAQTSTLTVSNGTLGTAQTITVTRQSTDFTHTITYTCGSTSGTICTKSSSTSISWTPPLTLANQNTSGTSVSVTLSLQTYNGSSTVGSATTKTVSMAIPSSVAPTCTVTVSDANGYMSTYGGYVQSRSKFSVTVTGTTSYGAMISSYKTTANGATYTASSFTTGVISSSGTNTISATVTDARGRTGSASTSVTVLAYSKPSITALSVIRCDSDGTENINGDYIAVTYSFSITSLSSKNSKTIRLYYKQTDATSWTTKTLTSAYSASGTTVIISADSSYSYDIQLRVTDAFETVTSTTSASTGFALMHFNDTGQGIAFGKISQGDNFDVAMDAVFRGAVEADTFTGTATNSEALGGYAPSMSAGGSTVVVRTANDVIYASYFRQNSGAETPTIGYVMVTNTSDGGVLRKISLANFITQLFANGVSTTHLELSASTPYIDFHFGESTDDYTARIIENSSGVLSAYNSISSASDKRLKKDFTDLSEDYIEVLRGLVPQAYRYINGDKYLNVGFIAQDVKELFEGIGIVDMPVISQGPDFDDGTEGYYSLDYNQISALNVYGWQYHDNLITDLYDKITKLEERIAVLEAQLS